MVHVSAFIYKNILCCDEFGRLNVDNEQKCFEIIFRHFSDNELIQKIRINWDDITGLKRSNKLIPIKKNNNMDVYDMDEDNLFMDDKLRLKEQLIIESNKYYELNTYYFDKHRNELINIDSISLKSYYIGIEYDTIHATSILIESGLLNYNNNYANYLNDGLPVWLWIPLLSNTLRKLGENLILLGNICLFIYTMYQLTKYTKPLKFMYNRIINPLFQFFYLEYINPIILKFTEVLYYSQFNIIITLISKLFHLVYNFIPINLFYTINEYIYYGISFITDNPIKGTVYIFFKDLWNLINVLFKPIYKLILYIYGFIRAYIYTDTTYISNIINFFKSFKTNIESIKQTPTNIENISNAGLNINRETIYDSIILIKTFSNKIWLSFGRPIKLCYDFIKYIRSGIVTKCCKKSKKIYLRSTQSKSRSVSNSNSPSHSFTHNNGNRYL